jgi:hypothetical protein
LWRSFPKIDHLREINAGQEAQLKSRKGSLERIKRSLHRQGAAAPSIEAIVPEIRSNDEFPIRPLDPSIDYVIGPIVIEWTFGVPYSKVPAFHKFLKDKEKFIANAVQSAPGVQYLGTYWVTSMGPSHYRTLWVYNSKEAIAGLNSLLQGSKNLFDAVKRLRLHWAEDPHRQELLYQPAAMFSDLSSEAAQNAFVAMSVPRPGRGAGNP